MSDITANIVVQPFDITIELEQPGITVTPEALELNIYAVGGTNGNAIGNVGDLQYNSGSGFGAIPSNIANYTNSNVNFNIANLKISGGTNGYVLQTDGTGNISWTAQSGGGGNGSPGGANSQVQFNDGGLFGGSANFTFDKTTGNLLVNNNITANTLTSNNATLGNNVTSNYFTGRLLGNANLAYEAFTVINAAQPNITSVGTLTGLTVINPIVGNTTGISNGTSYISIPTANGNVLIYANGNLAAQATINGNGQSFRVTDGLIVGDTTGTLSRISRIYGSLEILGNSGQLTANSVITTNNKFVSTMTTSAAPIEVSSSFRCANLNADLLDDLHADSTTTANTVVARNAQASFSANVITANLSGSIITANQPNITSVGTLTTLAISNTRISLGNNSSAGNFSVSIGNSATTNANAVAIGNISNANSNSVAIGRSANAFGNSSVAIGNTARTNQQGVAIGDNANSSAFGVSIGYDSYNAGSGIAVGGNSNAASLSIAIGSDTRALQSNSVGIGREIYSNGVKTVAIGSNINAGIPSGGQFANFVGVGSDISNIGDSAVAIGRTITNPGNLSVTIGSNVTNTAARTIVINATGNNISGTSADRLYIKPIRTVNNVTGLNQLYYDSTTGEIVVYVP